MADPVSDSREFVRGAARMSDLVYVISKVKKLIAQDIAHVSLVGLYQAKWGDAFNTTYNATAVAVAKKPSEKVVLVGEDGDVATYAAGKRVDEAIKPAPAMIRNARTIDGEVYVCGMKRQAYRRTGEGTWVDIGGPTPSSSEVVGFEAIDGFGANDIYATGWAGEIWHYNGSAWTRCASPVSTILTAICCAGDGTVYAAGQGGVLVRGRNDAWSQVAWKDGTNADLWDLCWFRDTLYAATMNGVFTLGDDELVPVDCDVTGYSLTTAQGVLWSIGHADVASFDGTVWRKYP